ncbi:MAG: homoserine dehydrogenase [Cellvibrionaceae bacterium]
MKTVNIGLCGLGTVGGGTFNVLARNSAEIQASANCQVKVSHVGVRRDNPAFDLSGVKVSKDIFDVVNDPGVDIVVEMIGGTTVAKDLVLQAISNGKHVVTANKALIAEFGGEIFSAAEKKNVCVAFEAAVAGGIPIIKVLREGLAANKIEWLAGIINGTGNFILTEMAQKGREFADVLKQAQKLGYAEADPTFDVEGIDAAHKLVILTSIAFGIPLQFESVFTEGISKIEPQDLSYAKELGYRVKHLGVARRHGNKVEMRVHPTLIPEKRLMAHVNGVMNAVMVNGDAVGSTLHSGPGAGAEPTASSVIADIVDIARELAEGTTPSVPHLGFSANYVSSLTIQPMSELETGYYLRINVEDKPGVLSNITEIFSRMGVSIEAVIQKEAEDDEATVQLILLTNKAIEGKMMQAINEIETLGAVTGQVAYIRVETLQ